MTSTITSVRPPATASEMAPPPPRPTSTVDATVWPGAKFTVEVGGAGAPAGHAVRYPAASGLVTVTVNAAATAPLPGTPPAPATARSRVSPSATAVVSRVSSRRAGATGVNPETNQ